jgi:ketosteroid isomerase-like protein
MRVAVEAFNARDLDGMLAVSDPDVEWHSTFAAVGGAVYHGHDGIRNWHRDLDDAWGGEVRFEIESCFDLDHSLLVFGTLHAHGRHSGAKVALPIAQVWRIRDGLISYCKTYREREDALQELRVSEDELVPVEL